MGERYDGLRSRQECRSYGIVRAVGAVAMVLVFSGVGGAAVNRAALVGELQLPAISLNLNLSFDPRDLRIPVSADPEAELKRLREQLNNDDRPALHLQLARVLSQIGRDGAAAGEFGAAATGYQKLLQAEPENATAHASYAEALMALDEDELAVGEIEETLILDEKLWKAHELSAELHTKHAVLAYDRGMLDLMRGHLAAAEESAREAVALAPEDPRPYVRLFLSKWLPTVFELHRDPRSGLAHLARYEEMSEILKKGAGLAPHYPRLRQFAIACKMAPFFAIQMLEGLSTAIWQELDQPQRRVLTSCRDEFFALANEALELRCTALLFAGVAAFMMDDKEEAYEYLRGSADAEQKSTIGLEVTVAFLTQERKWAQAVVVAEEFKDRKPSGRAYTWIGRIYAEQGRLKQAEEAFRAALGFRDATARANLGLGVVLLKANAEPLEALVPLRVAWQLARYEPEAALAWAVALALVGEAEEAKRRITEALAVWPENEAMLRVAKELGVETASKAAPETD